MRVKVYSILKRDDREYRDILDEFIKMSSRFSDLENINIFHKDLVVLKDENQIKALYTKLLEPYISKSAYNVVLDVKGKRVDSFEFSEIFEINSNINFFIGGAFGFESNFLSLCDMKVSLSNLTFNHKIAKLVLFEQIFRAFSILNNHPYHK